MPSQATQSDRTERLTGHRLGLVHGLAEAEVAVARPHRDRGVVVAVRVVAGQVVLVRREVAGSASATSTALTGIKRLTLPITFAPPPRLSHFRDRTPLGSGSADDSGVPGQGRTEG